MPEPWACEKAEACEQSGHFTASLGKTVPWFLTGILGMCSSPTCLRRWGYLQFFVFVFRLPGRSESGEAAAQRSTDGGHPTRAIGA